MTTAELVLPLELRGANAEAYYCREPEVLDEGPTGTGKTLMWLNLMNNLAWKFPGLHGLIVRKVAVTLATTCLASFNNEVRKPADGVTFFGGSKDRPAAYIYPNGSTIVVGGMDKGADGTPSKILSTQYHIAFWNEITEGTREDIETLKTRIRPHGEDLIAEDGTRFTAYRLVSDCNPSTDRHHILARCKDGTMKHFKSTLKDNPHYYDAEGNPTENGLIYLRTLEGLSGTRRQRLVDGIWLGMENAIYEALDRDKHLIALPAGTPMVDAGQGIDYGTVHISAGVVVTKASDGRIWVREVWTGGEEEQPILDGAHSYKARYRAIKGVVDPIPAMQMLAAKLGFYRSGHTPAEEAARKSKGGSADKEGSRVTNIFRVKNLIKTDALRFDLNGEGVKDLFDEALDYKWLHKDTENIEKYIVDRHNDDRVAAMEYAIEALMTVQVLTDFTPVVTTLPNRVRPTTMHKPAIRVGGGV